MLLIKVKPGVPRKMDATDNRSFGEWMSAVDQCVGLRGLSVYDLPDCLFRDWYDNRLRPIHAANRALKRAADAVEYYTFE